MYLQNKTINLILRQAEQMTWCNAQHSFKKYGVPKSHSGFEWRVAQDSFPPTWNQASRVRPDPILVVFVPNLNQTSSMFS